MVTKNGLMHRMAVFLNLASDHRQATAKYLAENRDQPRLEAYMLLLDCAIGNMKRLIKEQPDPAGITSNIQWATIQLESIARQVGSNQDEEKQSILDITEEILKQMRDIAPETPLITNGPDDASPPAKFDLAQSASEALPKIEARMADLVNQMRHNTERLMSTRGCGGAIQTNKMVGN